jgi:hypothetical protein
MNMMLSTSALTANAAEITDAAEQSDAILQLIADHKAAIAASDVAMAHYGEMEEVIPKEKRQGDMFVREVTEVAGDDPGWTAACHWFNDALNKSDEIALQMLAAPITSISSLAALMAYAGEHVEQGFLWPEEIVIDEIDDKARDWERWVLMRAAKVMRELGDEPSAAPANGPEIGRAAHMEELASAFIRIEGGIYDMVSAARLAENQLHEAVGNLNCAHDGDSRYTEVPDYESAGLAVFAVSNVTTVAKSLLELHGRLFDEAAAAGAQARTA